MTDILVLYYSSYGHIERMAGAVAQGVRGAGGRADIKRVPELVPEQVARESGYKMDQEAPLATVDDLPAYDGIIFGTGTRFGNMSAQMKSFLDQAGKLWIGNHLVGKAASVFTSSASQHGGQESTVLTFHTVLLHFGLVLVGLPYAFEGQNGLEEVKGGSPYGASTITGIDGSRWPSSVELDAARFQGAHVTGIAARLAGKREG